MKPSEVKFCCDLISIVADAISNDTIPEAVDHLLEKYSCVENPVLEHVFNVLSKNKQQYENSDPFNS